MLPHEAGLSQSLQRLALEGRSHPFYPSTSGDAKGCKEAALVPLVRLSICFHSNLQGARQKHSAIMAP